MKETLLVKEQDTTFEITASNNYKYETLNRRERRKLQRKNKTKTNKKWKY